MSTSASDVRFGQVWVCRNELMGPVHYLVVSSDGYNAAFSDRRVIAVEIDSRALHEGAFREPIVDAGTAMLDRLVWLARGALHEQVGELHPSRRTEVAIRMSAI